MVLGLPLELLVRDVLRIGALVALLFLCLPRRHEGRWALLGAVAGGVGALLYGYFLVSWVLYTQAGIRSAIELADAPVIGEVLTWLDLVVLAALIAAVLADRPVRRGCVDVAPRNT